MIQVKVADQLQNFSNEYVFSTQDDVAAAVGMLFDFAGYGEEHLENGTLSIVLVSEKPLDTGKPICKLCERKDNQS